MASMCLYVCGIDFGDCLASRATPELLLAWASKALLQMVDANCEVPLPQNL